MMILKEGIENEKNLNERRFDTTNIKKTQKQKWLLSASKYDQKSTEISSRLVGGYSSDYRYISKNNIGSGNIIEYGFIYRFSIYVLDLFDGGVCSLNFEYRSYTNQSKSTIQKSVHIVNHSTCFISIIQSNAFFESKLSEDLLLSSVTHRSLVCWRATV